MKEIWKAPEGEIIVGIEEVQGKVFVATDSAVYMFEGSYFVNIED